MRLAILHPLRTVDHEVNCNVWDKSSLGLEYWSPYASFRRTPESRPRPQHWTPAFAGVTNDNLRVGGMLRRSEVGTSLEFLQTIQRVRRERAATGAGYRLLDLLQARDADQGG